MKPPNKPARELTDDERAERVAAEVRKTAAERMEEVAEQPASSKHTDYRYDKKQNGFWDIRYGTLHTEDRPVNNSIPREKWRVVDPPDEPQPDATVNESGDANAANTRRPRGRPRRERLVPPTEDIARYENGLTVHDSTWLPGAPQIIKDLLPTDGGMIPKKGVRIFNTYRPPDELAPDDGQGEPDEWIDLCTRLIPEEIEREWMWHFMAHMVQRPGEKPNFGIALMGEQGIGKDSIWVPVAMAIGENNARTIGPDDLFGNFNPWVESVLLVVNEIRPAREEHRHSDLYERTKPLLAAPPLMLALNQKFQKVRYVANVVRLVLFTNHRTVLFIAEDDRRLTVLESLLRRNWHVAEGKPNYFRDYYAWLKAGGAAQVRRWLLTRDIRAFDAQGAALDTPAKARLRLLWNSPDSTLDDALERICRPEIAFGFQLLEATATMPNDNERDELQKLLKGRNQLDHLAGRSGYDVVRPQRGDRFRATTADGVKREARLALVAQSLRSTPRAALETRILAALAAVAGQTTLRAVKNE